jgi:[ribosomal protein S18]-alanine N-acetyltransferase
MMAAPGPLAACEIRELRAADVPAAAGQYRDLFVDGTWNAAAVGRSLDGPGSFALLAHTAGQIAGLVVARAVADECEILWIAVVASRRRSGIGRGLLRAALGRAAGLGARTAYLEVAAANRAAIDLYDGEGFRRCGRRPAYYRGAHEGAPCDALVYKKELGSGEGSPPQSSPDHRTNGETKAS